MKDDIITILEKYDTVMSDPFYSGVESDDFEDISEEVQAGIRNKLTPIKNLVALIEAKEFEFTLASLKQVKESINYLSGKEC